MQINRVAPPRDLHSVRQMMEGFAPDKLSLPALTSRRGDGYWTLSYGELAQQVASLAAGVAAVGIRAGDRVGVISENRSEWVITYLAVTSFGAVIVPFDILLKTEELASIMRASGARLVFTSAEYHDKVLKAADAGVRIVLCDPHPEIERAYPGLAVGLPWSAWEAKSAEVARAEAGAPVPFGTRRYIPFPSLVGAGRALRDRGADPYAAPLTPDDLAALIFTSGTTGVPKGVMLSHRNLVENGDGVQQTTDLGPGDNWVIVLPYHHTYPSCLGIFVPLLTYGEITTVPSMKTHVLLGIMKDRGATCIPAMPLLIEKLYKGVLANVKAKGPAVKALFTVMLAVSSFAFKVLHLRIGKILFGSVARELGVTKLRFFISGGGPIAKEIIDGMEALGLVTYQGYGLSESSPVISSTCPAHNKPGSVGMPLANVEVKIIGEDENGNGEILARGSNIMMGYLDMPDKTREVVDPEGWLHTGDIGTLDKDGYLYITGRLKNIIVTKGGKNIYPEEIENLLLQSPLISEVVVLGRLDDEGGEYPFAVVYPDPDAMKALAEERGAPLDAEATRKLIRTEIQKCTAGAAGYKVPRGFDISPEELPKTSTRKVKRFMFAGTAGQR
jgi:long-chain acyl-CoA synthetase